jgi:succinate dehydrogenase / fumarate reductase flavoprotein subunit
VDTRGSGDARRRVATKTPVILSVWPSKRGRIRDPELVQFHPSGLIEPEDSAGTLVFEAARGEGGILRNDLGERFMKRYDPERMELSTRDRVALAAYTEIKEGRGTARGGVWLDVSHLPRTQIMERLPRVYQT